MLEKMIKDLMSLEKQLRTIAEGYREVTYHCLTKREKKVVDMLEKMNLIVLRFNPAGLCFVDIV